MSDCPDLPEWIPDPHPAFDDWSTWRDAALDWISEQDEPWTADELRAALPEPRPHWPGSVVNIASRRNMIRLTGRVTRSSAPTRKGSLLPYWTSATRSSDDLAV